ncbi:hypothetical protein B0T16DRAFT_391096 [Cercophora newfieldiana]|uniref:Uncharacterized protein n=1 Tax=Cercophora newfieldiana TaxID=92897 RepID=A0AA39Y886_9PEZI|nr:hypothetical protein B0T16DRAFT_391096 [Cercophora newfieldiana]
MAMAATPRVSLSKPNAAQNKIISVASEVPALFPSCDPVIQLAAKRGRDEAVRSAKELLWGWIAPSAIRFDEGERGDDQLDSSDQGLGSNLSPFKVSPSRFRFRLRLRVLSFAVVCLGACRDAKLSSGGGLSAGKAEGSLALWLPDSDEEEYRLYSGNFGLVKSWKTSIVSY